MSTTIDFLREVLPFDQLDQSWLEEAANALDVEYFPKDTQVLVDLKSNAFLYLVMKGRIAEYESDFNHPKAYYAAGSQFGADRLLDEKNQDNYLVVEEAILYRLPHEFFQRLLQYNPNFEKFYQQDITQKLTQLHQQLQQDSSSEALMSLVRNAPLQALVQLPPEASIKLCVEKMQEFKTDACVVEKDGEFGVVAASDLLRGLALYDCSLDTPIVTVASFPMISIGEHDYLFNAMLKMTKFGIDRVIVRSNDGFSGILHQRELMNMFANQSGLVMLTLARANKLEDLTQVTEQIDRLVEGLNNKGVKAHYIAKLVNELNRKLQAKLWEIMDPEGKFDAATLIVMGSEGRLEQIVRTDQDNALILNDELATQPDLVAFANDYSAKLIEMGFPPCPGNIMVSNQVWRLSEAEFDQQLRGWFDKPSLENYMHISILVDAQVVRGDEQKLAKLKKRLFAKIRENEAFLPHFAAAALQFETPIGLFGRLISDVDGIDLKKGGIFPIVHGVRCLAMQKGIEKTNTHWRIRALIDGKVLSEEFGVELGETLNYLNSLRLDAMLYKQSLGLKVDNAISVERLSNLQQDLMKEAFSVVNKFKKFLQMHFKLDRVM